MATGYRTMAVISDGALAALRQDTAIQRAAAVVSESLTSRVLAGVRPMTFDGFNMRAFDDARRMSDAMSQHLAGAARINDQITRTVSGAVEMSAAATAIARALEASAATTAMWERAFKPPVYPKLFSVAHSEAVAHINAALRDGWPAGPVEVEVDATRVRKDGLGGRLDQLAPIQYQLLVVYVTLVIYVQLVQRAGYGDHPTVELASLAKDLVGLPGLVLLLTKRDGG